MAYPRQGKWLRRRRTCWLGCFLLCACGKSTPHEVRPATANVAAESPTAPPPTVAAGPSEQQPSTTAPTSSPGATSANPAQTGSEPPVATELPRGVEPPAGASASRPTAQRNNLRPRTAETQTSNAERATPSRSATSTSASASATQRSASAPNKPAAPTTATQRPRTQATTAAPTKRAPPTPAAQAATQTTEVARQPAAEPVPQKPKAVVLPSSDHVRFEVPTSLQPLLAADPRIAPWVKRVLPDIDACYARARRSNPNAAGTVAVNLTMHANARPTAKPRSVPSALSSMLTCATGKLWNKRPPLFTGPEGQRHTVYIHFGK